MTPIDHPLLAPRPAAHQDEPAWLAHCAHAARRALPDSLVLAVTWDQHRLALPMRLKPTAAATAHQYVLRASTPMPATAELPAYRLEPGDVAFTGGWEVVGCAQPRRDLLTAAVQAGIAQDPTARRAQLTARLEQLARERDDRLDPQGRPLLPTLIEGVQLDLAPLLVDDAEVRHTITALRPGWTGTAADLVAVATSLHPHRVPT